jgi:hypothetical protein|tara:strand:+ start:174 stop:287 length:114 start_codon:yes stop_codon:yes gene_type:complete
VAKAATRRVEVTIKVTVDVAAVLKAMAFIIFALAFHF